MQENMEISENRSGQGKGSAVPEEVKKFNWGALCLTWIWGLFNKSYITLVIFACPLLFLVLKYIIGLQVPAILFRVFAFILAIWFGIKGNEWAWQNKHWKSIKHFHDVQKKWAIAGIAVYITLFVLLIAGIIAALIIPTSFNKTEIENNIAIKKAISLVSFAFNGTEKNQCELTSNGLAACMGERALQTVVDNKIMLGESDNYLEFTGDGNCTTPDTCYITIVTPNSNEKIGLFINEEGNVETNKTDISNIIKKYIK